ncbi:MAG: ABC transporter ATP-binding protein [bacterium]
MKPTKEQPLDTESSPPIGPTSTLSWKDILSLASRHRPQLIKANIIAILAALVSVPIPLLMPLLVDEVLLHQPATLLGTMDKLFPEHWHGPVFYIGVILVLTVTLRFVAMLLNVLQSRQFTLIAKDVTYRIRTRLLTKLQSTSMTEYETLGSGGISSHLVTDINVIDDFIGASVSRFAVALLTLVGVTVVLLWMHWQLALFILLMNPFVIYLTTLLGKYVKKLRQRENSAVEIFQQSLTETLDAIGQVRASNRERHYFSRLQHQAKDVRDHAAQYAWKSDAGNRFSFFVFLTGFEIFRGTTMVLVVFSDLSIGQMMAVFSYLWFMMAPVQDVLGIQYAYYAANGALERINDLIALKEEPRYPHLENPFSHKQTVAVSLRHVSFSYGNGPLVLNDVNLNIGVGEKVALVGASGGGKSTLVQVILGLYPLQKGKVYFNGIPHDKIGLDVIRDNVASVLQHPALFNDTVRENLCMGRQLDDSELWQALDIAQLSDVIREMPNQLDTLVGRQGVRLSGGQRQRLAVARMVLSKPKVVILDEATSALDTVTEAKLHTALSAFLKNRTTLIIAHRLSAVKQADRVYVFDGGRIIEHGHHDELIQNDGLYRRLYGQSL